MTVVSIIIPTYNRLSQLQQVLAALECQEYPQDQIEVIVVSDGSTDGTHAYLSNLKTKLNLICVIQANAGPAAARNNGIRRASSKYVLFIDDDVVPTPQLVGEHLRLHATAPNLVVLGPMLSPDDFGMEPWVSWEQSMLLKQYYAMQRGDWEPTARQFYTGNTSLARHYLVEANGFDERFRRAEDVELAYRLDMLGVRFIFNPQAIGYHYAKRSFRSWLESPYAYGRNDVIFAREHHKWILDKVQTEFTQRNVLTRVFTRLCLDRPRLSNAAQNQLNWIANASHRLGSKRIPQASYSAIFNLRYYQGIADELGGRALFFGQSKPSLTPAVLPECSQQDK